MKNMMKRLLLIALVSGMNSGPVMATDVATQPAEQIGGLKKVGDTIATNARKAWGGIKRAGSAVKEQLGRKHLKRNALITLLVAALTAARAHTTRHRRRQGIGRLDSWNRALWGRVGGQDRFGYYDTDAEAQKLDENMAAGLGLGDYAYDMRGLSPRVLRTALEKDSVLQKKESDVRQAFTPANWAVGSLKYGADYDRVRDGAVANLSM